MRRLFLAGLAVVLALILLSMVLAPRYTIQGGPIYGGGTSEGGGYELRGGITP